ncbi:MAG: paraquat-inducible protein A, partial [Gluconacetobacter diazotrophicus]|nr:paraquat-inducible protein A [Gluconacetobacter diazotrophicus]
GGRSASTLARLGTLRSQGEAHLRGFRLRREKSRSPTLLAIEGLAECRSCGFFQRVPDLEPGQVATCRRCHDQLGRRRANPPISTPLAFCVASALLYLVCVTTTIMTLDVFGRRHTVSLFTGPIELWGEGWRAVAALVMFATVVMPPIVIGLMLAILLAGSRPSMPRWAPRLLRRYEQLRPWSMIEVYILGVFVAYTKLIDMAHVTLGPSVFALAGLMLTMAATDSTVDFDRFWDRKRVSRFIRRADGRRVVVSVHDASEMELPLARRMVSCPTCGLVCAAERDLPQEAALGQCPRCGDVLRRRKPQAVLRCVALLSCAVILYVPANVFPIITIIKFHRGGGHTILEGVRELYEAHLLPLALLVFFASITVPVLKIIGLGLMTFGTWRRSRVRLVDRSRLYRVVDFIGRWSMIDVFMVSILVAVVRFSGLANVTADAGVYAFASVVVITIFAAGCFDPRVMWDAAGMNGTTAAQRRAVARGPVERAADDVRDLRGGPNGRTGEPARA